MGLCFCAYPFVQSLNQLYMVHAGLALGLVCSGLMPNVVLLSNWFIHYRGSVIGLLVAASSLAGAILPLAISPLVINPEFGWRWGFASLSLAFLIFALIPGMFLLRAAPAEVGQTPDGRPTKQHKVQHLLDGVSFHRALRSRTLWVLAFGSACLWFCIQAMNSQATIFFEQEIELSPQRATLLFSAIYWSSVVGKLLFGALSDRLPKRKVLLITSIVLLCGCLLLFDTKNGMLVLNQEIFQLGLFTMVFGLGFGGSFTMIQLVVVESFGQQALGKILGVVIFIDSMGAALGTALTGQLRTTTGGYLEPFIMVVIVAALGVAGVLLIRPVRASTTTD
jgi:sugar phosphate permease